MFFFDVRNNQMSSADDSARQEDDLLLQPLRDDAVIGLAAFVESPPPPLLIFERVANQCAIYSRVSAASSDWRSAYIYIFRVLRLVDMARSHPDIRAPGADANILALQARGHAASLDAKSVVRPRALEILRAAARAAQMNNDYEIAQPLTKQSQTQVPVSAPASLLIAAANATPLALRLQRASASGNASSPALPLSPLPLPPSPALLPLPLPSSQPQSPTPLTPSHAISQYDALRRAFTTFSPRLTLRRIVLPNSLITVFSQLASDNTNALPRGIETCGLLLGRAAAEGGDFVVSHLFLPAQSGGENECELTTAGEDALLNFCLENALLTLGWIHTHPSQGCFLSAVDVHTHASYQVSLREAVAIVVAPRDPNVGPGGRFSVFRLTDETTAPSVLATPQPNDPSRDYGPAAAGARRPLASGAFKTGMSVILGCVKRGFHPHEEVGEMTLYEESQHVAFEATRGLDFVDQRHTTSAESICVPAEEREVDRVEKDVRGVRAPYSATTSYPRVPRPADIYNGTSGSLLQRSEFYEMALKKAGNGDRSSGSFPASSLYPRVPSAPR